MKVWVRNPNSEDEARAMKNFIVAIVLSSVASGCVTSSVDAPSVGNELGFGVGERWRMECLGSDGAMQVPIFATITRFNERTGKADLLVNDRDGMDGEAVAYLSGRNFTMFGESAQWSEDGRSLSMPVADCPGGFRVIRL